MSFFVKHLSYLNQLSDLPENQKSLLMKRLNKYTKNKYIIIL